MDVGDVWFDARDMGVLQSKRKVVLGTFGAFALEHRTYRGRRDLVKFR